MIYLVEQRQSIDLLNYLLKKKILKEQKKY